MTSKYASLSSSDPNPPSSSPAAGSSSASSSSTSASSAESTSSQTSWNRSAPQSERRKMPLPNQLQLSRPTSPPWTPWPTSRWMTHQYLVVATRPDPPCLAPPPRATRSRSEQQPWALPEESRLCEPPRAGLVSSEVEPASPSSATAAAAALTMDEDVGSPR